MSTRALRLVVIAGALFASACTVSQTEEQGTLMGPSTFATAVSVTANPDTVALGQSGTSSGQQSLVIVTVLDQFGQPKPNETVRLETLVNGNPSDCGQLSLTALTTGVDGRASAVFTAPGTPPDCPNFNADGTVTIQATPVGTNFQATSRASSTVNVFMAPPTAPLGSFAVNISISPIAGIRNYTLNGSGSLSPGHAITSYVWTLSDGHTENGPIIDHDFASAGTYFVTLTVTDDAQQTAFKTVLLTVN